MERPNKTRLQLCECICIHNTTAKAEYVRHLLAWRKEGEEREEREEREDWN